MALFYRAPNTLGGASGRDAFGTLLLDLDAFDPIVDDEFLDVPPAGGPFASVAASATATATIAGATQSGTALGIGSATIKQHLLVPGSTVPGTTTTDAITTQTSGGAMLVAIARGEWATGSPTAPTGNLSNTFTLESGPNAYASFPSSKTGIYIANPNKGGAGQTGTVAWG